LQLTSNDADGKDQMNSFELKVWNCVVERDGARCLRCGERGDHVHHVIPRSHFGKSGHDVCWDERNMMCLCMDCHLGIVWAHTYDGRIEQLRVLAELYDYEYDDSPFNEYVLS